MTNQNNSIPKIEAIADMYDLASLAEYDMQWMNVAISDIRKRLIDIKNELGEKNIIGFYALENMVDMYQYISEKHLSYYFSEVEAHEAELKANKKAVTL